MSLAKYVVKFYIPWNSSIKQEAENFLAAGRSNKLHWLEALTAHMQYNALVNLNVHTGTRPRSIVKGVVWLSPF